MTTHSRASSRRRAQQAPTEPDDAFIAQIMEITAWVRSHSRAVILMTVALVAIVAGSYYYVRQQASVRERATLELEQIQEVLLLGERDAAQGQLASFIARFPESPQVDEARILLGQLHLEQAAPADAIPVLREASGSMRGPLAIQAAVLLAAAYEESGDFERAEELYLGVADRSDLTFQKRDALADAARLRAARGDLEGAAQLYRRILVLLGDDHPLSDLYRMRLAELEARLQSG